MLSRNLTKLGWLGKANNNPTLPVWTPAQLGSDLALWLDAEDASTITLNAGNVSQWNDKSGKNNNALQATASAQPAYLSTGLNNKPTVSLDGTTDFMTASVAGLQSFTSLSYFSVFQTPVAAAPDTNTAIFFGFGNAGTASGPYPANRALSLAATTAFLTGEYLTIVGEINHSGRLGSTTYRRNANTPEIINFQTSSVGSAVWANTSAVSIDLAVQITASTNLAPSAIGYTVDNDLHIGVLRAGGSLSTFSPAVRFSEIIVLSAVASTDDRQRLEGYLAWKWGLTYALPANHPYRWDTSLFGGTNLNGFDADAKTYIASVETADVQELEIGVKTAINSFIVGAKADGIWNAIKSSAILAGARTLTGALQPLKGTAPTNSNFVSGDYNRKTGLVGDGSTKSLLANYTLLATTANSTHFSFYQTQAPSASTCIIIGSWNNNQTVDAVWNSGSLFLFSRDVDYLSVAQTNGFIGHARSNNTTVTTRAEGTSVVASSNILSPQYDMPMRVFARNNIPSDVANFHSNARLAFYSIGEAIDLAKLDTRVTQLMTDINNAIP